MGNLLTTFLKMVRWKIRNSIQPLYTPLQMTDRLKFKSKLNQRNSEHFGEIKEKLQWCCSANFAPPKS